MAPNHTLYVLSIFLGVLGKALLTDGHHCSSGTIALTTPPGTLAMSLGTTVTPSSSTISIGVISSSIDHSTHPRTVIALGISLGILLVLIMCFSILLCMRRPRHSHGPALINGVAPGPTKVVDPKSQSFPPATTNYHEVAITLPSISSSRPFQETPEQPARRSQLSVDNINVTTLPGHANQIEATLPSPSNEVEEAVLVSRSDCSDVVDTASSEAVAVEAFSPGQDEEFHPEICERIHKNNLTKDDIMQMAPMRPKERTVNSDYNPKLDEKRPREIEEYLRTYRIIFIIDDSTSMTPHWHDTRNALSEIGNHAFQYFSDAVDVCFLNHAIYYEGVRGADTVLSIFGEFDNCAGNTPTGGVLKSVLDEEIKRLDDAWYRGEYSSELPLDIIILTDGVPNVEPYPAEVIEKAARQLKDKMHHPNWITIQFVQIGNDPHAKPHLLSLIDGPNNDMVGTISYDDYKNRGNGKLTAEVLESIILGGLHPNLRAYWNQWRHRKYEKTSQVIY